MLTPPLLEPLSYHRAIAQHLRTHEPEVWQWTAAQVMRAEHQREVRTALLRETYRLEQSAHPEAYADCAAVMAVLGLDEQVTLYQAADGAMNAALVFAPGEPHLIFHGPILEKLTHEERVALIGHELSHYKLWTAEDGAFHICSQILEHALAYPAAAGSHIETARLYRLYTELYADRGGALAAAKPGPAISTLVKTMTGLTNVDAEAYLRQAAELDEQALTSQGVTHPEIFMRAQALEKWWRGDGDVDQWLSERIEGRMSMHTLDLRGQSELAHMTRRFLARLLGGSAGESAAALGLVQRYFPDWAGEAPIDLSALSAARIDESVRDYLFALSFDVAMADADAKEDILRAAAEIARAMNAEEGYRAALSRDLRMPKRAVAKLLGPMRAPS